MEFQLIATTLLREEPMLCHCFTNITTEYAIRHFQLGSNIKSIQIGYYSTYFVTSNGDVFSLRPKISIVDGKRFIKYTDLQLLKLKHVEKLSGCYYRTIALTKMNEVYCWPNNVIPQNDVIENIVKCDFLLKELWPKEKVIDVGAGELFSAVLTSIGRVLIWKDEQKVTVLKELNDEYVTKLWCVRWGIFMWTISKKLYYKGMYHSRYKANALNGLSKDAIVKNVVGGKNSSLILTESGEVFVHGGGACEELGISEQLYQGTNELCPVKDVENLSISQIACGEGFTLFLTKSGEVKRVGGRRNVGHITTLLRNIRKKRITLIGAGVSQGFCFAGPLRFDQSNTIPKLYTFQQNAILCDVEIVN